VTKAPLFFSLMCQQHQKNFISTIQLSDGFLTTFIDEVGDAYICYFRDLLGSSKVTLPLDDEVSRSGPCIDHATHASLLAPITNDIIKQALFSIDDDKASGPDGYTFFFFKKNHWILLVVISVLQSMTSLYLGNFSSRLTTLSLLLFPNLSMFLRLLISDLFPTVMWYTR